MADEPPPPPIGARLPRADARRLAAGRGRFTDDLSLPRMVHVAFVRSPYAHARIAGIGTETAAGAAGVVRVATGEELARLCRPWTASHDLFPSHRSPPQHPLAIDRARWQGEPVAAVLAETRALAEDAAERVEVEWEPLPAVADPEAALAPDAPLIHPALGTNLSFETALESGDVDGTFAAAATVVEEEFQFGRHTGVTLEMRAIIADFDPSIRHLTVHTSHQVPHQQQELYARLLGIPEHNVRVVCPDVGGAFGVKLQLYGDEIATAALSMLVGRPVKFQADRMEAFLTDIHARDHRIRARMALDRDGRITAVAVDDLFAIGPYSQYPRTSIGEGSHILRLTGAPYRHRTQRGRLRMVFQNKNLIGHYRAVGQPIATAVTERLVDLAAEAAGIDPIEMRRRNYIGDEDFPYVTPTGVDFDGLSLAECLDALVGGMDIEALREEQTALREEGVLRGIGIATFVELTAPGPDYYGEGNVRVTSQDGCIVKLEPSGTLRCTPSITEQGQGTEAAVAQIVAAAIGVGIDDVRVATGDSAQSPYGGGAWASRGMSIGGEAVWLAARALRDNVLELAGHITQRDPGAMDIQGGVLCEAATGREIMPLAELARIGYFRQDTLPAGVQPELAVVRHHVPRRRPFIAGNGVQGSYLEVDADTGFVTLLRHGVAHDGGRVINPLLYEEQLRGGVVQGLGAALFEECVYDADGQMLNASMADYLVPMPVEVPDIDVFGVAHPLTDTALGAKGVGEAGTSGASGAVLNAINDALRPLAARIARLPATPERVVEAIWRANGRDAG